MEERGGEEGTLVELEAWPMLEEPESSSEKAGLVRRLSGSRISGEGPPPEDLD